MTENIKKKEMRELMREVLREELPKIIEGMKFTYVPYSPQFNPDDINPKPWSPTIPIMPYEPSFTPGDFPFGTPVICSATSKAD